ncbi:hypothetical protein SMA679_1639 [Streptococcus macedonicus]|nr:hypothetical protein SMA679_1639 [Streptococcus macedonicus]
MLFLVLSTDFLIALCLLDDGVLTERLLGNLSPLLPLNP